MQLGSPLGNGEAEPSAAKFPQAGFVHMLLSIHFPSMIDSKNNDDATVNLIDDALVPDSHRPFPFQGTDQWLPELWVVTQ